MYIDEADGFLLGGYPKDKVPLYEPAHLESCSFMVNKNSEPWWGSESGGLRAGYTVYYQTQADPTAVAEYYSGLVSAADPSALYKEGDVAGTIGDLKVYVSITPPDSNGRSTIGLTVDVDPATAGEGNPYFEDFPSGLAKLDESYAAYADGFSVVTAEKSINYSQRFRADAQSANPISSVKRDYGTKDEFTTDGASIATWKDAGYLIQVQVVPGTGQPVVSLSAPMK